MNMVALIALIALHGAGLQDLDREVSLSYAGSLSEPQWQLLLREGSIGVVGFSQAQRDLLWLSAPMFFRSEESELSSRYGQPKSDLPDIMLQPSVSLLTVAQDQIRLVFKARQQDMVQDQQGEGAMRACHEAEERRSQHGSKLHPLMHKAARGGGFS